MKANIYYLDLEDKMILSIHHNSIQNILDNTPIPYFTTRKQKLFFKKVLVHGSIFHHETDRGRIEYNE